MIGDPWVDVVTEADVTDYCNECERPRTFFAVVLTDGYHSITCQSCGDRHEWNDNTLHLEGDWDV